MCLELILHPKELSPSTSAPISADEDVLCIMQLLQLRFPSKQSPRRSFLCTQCAYILSFLSLYSF